MIETILPKVYRHYIDLPIMGEIADAFTSFLVVSGYSRSSVKDKIKNFDRVEQWCKTNNITTIYDLSAELLEQWWFQDHKKDSRLAGTIRQFEQFLLVNKIITPQTQLPAISPVEKLLEIYRTYLAHQKGFSAATIQAHLFYVQCFLTYIKVDPSLLNLSTINLQQVYSFMQERSKTSNRFSLQHVVAYLRSFLRYLFQQNLISDPLYQQIESPRTYRLENLPKVLSRQIVLDLLGSVNRSTPEGCRDYAILYLAAHYGLRASEIVTLKLEDVHWKQRILLIQQTKTGNILYLPLTEEAMEAIGRYIQIARPNQVAYREVFLRNHAPHGILKPTAVHDIFQNWAKKSGLLIPFHGSHCLRHSLANYLLEQGQSAKMIGDLFGHLNLESTSAYLRVQCHQLRRMVLPIPILSNERAKELLSSSLTSVVDTDQFMLFLLDNASSVLNSKKTSKKKIQFKVNQDFQSSFHKEFQNYLLLHRSLGKKYAGEVGILHQWDSYLFSYETKLINTENSADCTMDLFWSWLATLTNKATTTRRRHFLIVRKFLLYVSRFHPEIKVPDFHLFPVAKTRFRPYRFTDEQVALLLYLSHYLPSQTRNPARASTVHLGILLLYVTGMRRGELLRLCWRDYDPIQKILTIRESKFHKSRLLPVSDLVAKEIQLHQISVEKFGLMIQPEDPIISDLYGRMENSNNRNKTGKVKEYSGAGFSGNWKILCLAAGINNNQGKLPRLHDLRHSFAMRNLDRFYEERRNPYAELPVLSAYMGHVNIASTQYYLSQMRQSLFVANEWYLDYVRAVTTKTKSNHLPTRKKGVENWIEGIIVPSFSFERKRTI